MSVLVLSLRGRSYRNHFTPLDLKVIPVDMTQDGWDAKILQHPEDKVVIGDSRADILKALEEYLPEVRPILINPKRILIGANLNQRSTRSDQIINASENGWFERLRLVNSKVPIIIVNNIDKILPILTSKYPKRKLINGEAGRDDIEKERAPIYHISFFELVELVAKLPPSLLSSLKNKQGQLYLDVLMNHTPQSQSQDLRSFQETISLVEEIADADDNGDHKFISEEKHGQVMELLSPLIIEHLEERIGHKLNRGDLVRFDPEIYRNDGLYIIDRKSHDDNALLRELYFEIDDYGSLPPDFKFPDFPFTFFVDRIEHNHIVWPDTGLSWQFNPNPPPAPEDEGWDCSSAPMVSLDLEYRGQIYRIYFARGYDDPIMKPFTSEEVYSRFRHKGAYFEVIDEYNVRADTREHHLDA